MNKHVVIILGPTAVGKTRLSIEAAKIFNGEIVSADSMQVYKYMDIGSAKPTEEEKAGIPHHLIDCVKPWENTWSVADYQREAKSKINQILAIGKLPIVSGGTGLYINSLIYNMDFAETIENIRLRRELQEYADKYGPLALHHRLRKVDENGANRIHPNNIKKVIRAIEVAEQTDGAVADFKNSFVKSNEFQFTMIGLKMERQLLYDRIENRVDVMMEAGLLQEVKDLIAKGLTKEHNSMKGIGYKELCSYLDGNCSLEDAVNQIKQNTRNYAKRQMTWFRRYEDIKWFQLEKEINIELLTKDISRYIAERTGF